MSTSKRKKEARAQQLKVAAKLREYEKQYSVKKPVSRDFVEYTPPDTYRREDGQAQCKSLNSGQHNTYKNDVQRYTGSLIKGIATMHKSNAVPVLDDEHIIDIAHMRR